MDHPSNRPNLHDLEALFTYHSPTGTQSERYAVLRAVGKQLAETILVCTPPCADQSAALRHVRDAIFTANAAVALESQESSESFTNMDLVRRPYWPAK